MTCVGPAMTDDGGSSPPGSTHMPLTHTAFRLGRGEVQSSVGMNVAAADEKEEEEVADDAREVEAEIEVDREVDSDTEVETDDRAADTAADDIADASAVEVSEEMETASVVLWLKEDVAVS